jgi:hypothetical protein
LRSRPRGQHHLIVSVVETFARSLPFVPLFRRAPGAVRLLVELAADAAAARECGPEAVRAALVILDRGAAAPGPALAMGHEQIPIRLRRLTRPAGRTTAPRRGVARAAIGLAVVALHGAIGFGVLTVAATMSCAPI